MKQHIILILILLSAGLLMGQWTINEGFEDITSLPAGWNYFDDGDGLVWRNLQHNYAHSGARAAFVDNYLPNENADWLVMPQIQVNSGDSLFFYTRAWYGTEGLKVYVSTGAGTPGALNILLADITNITTTYQEVALPLETFAGLNIHLAFYWECESYGILVDDVKVGQEEVIEPELNLPDSISFYLSESYSLDLAPYIVCTNPEVAVITAAANNDLVVDIDGLQATISSHEGFVGQTELTFNLYDPLSGLDATDTIEVTVQSDPSVDLYLQSVLSPRLYEYIEIPVWASVVLANSGQTSFENQAEISLTVFNEAQEQVFASTVLQAVNLAPDGQAQVDFGTAFVPTEEGLHNFRFEIISSDDNPANNVLNFPVNVVLRITSGGPDSFGYRYADSNDPLGPEYDWIDISQTGTSTVTYGVPSWGGDDNFSEPIPLGFDFPFYGTDYSTAHVDINGEILLADNSWYNAYPGNNWDSDGNMFNYMYPIPGYAQMPALIAVYWDDLHADQDTGDVYFQSFGSAPERYTIIQWNNLRFHAGTGGTRGLKFQVILSEDGTIKMQYHTVSTGQTGATIPHDMGASATIALQNEAASTGLVYLREIVQNNTYMGVEPQGNMLHDELAILFYAGDDEQAPIIAHEPVGNSFSSDRELVANILDMNPITATLYYDSGAGWQSAEPVGIEGNNYHYMISSLAQGSTIRYYFEATDSETNSSRLPAGAPAEYYSYKVLPTADAQVLIAYSGTQDYQRTQLPIYEDLLSGLGITYDIFDWEEELNYSFPTQYKGILAYATTGSANERMYYMATALTDYLDLGTIANPKNLWFASDGLASGQHAHPNSSSIRRLMSGYFRTSYVPTGFGGGSNGLGGPDSYSYVEGTILALPGTPVGTVDTEYPVYANSPDCIFPNDAAGDPYYDEVPYPELGANYVYAFEDGPFGGQAYLYHGVAGTVVDTPSYRTMYFSFDFSQLTSPDDRQEWISDLMDWWDISPVSSDDSTVPQLTSAIHSVYPNPFNPTTTIRYSIASSGELALSVYNIRGQKVLDLVKGYLESGDHSITWDGRDSLGDPVASGVYYLRLDSGSFSTGKKISLIK